jgi:hypothetical protein
MQLRKEESSCDVGRRKRESGRRCDSREQREKALSGREWRKKLKQ